MNTARGLERDSDLGNALMELQQARVSTFDERLLWDLEHAD